MNWFAVEAQLITEKVTISNYRKIRYANFILRNSTKLFLFPSMKTILIFNFESIDDVPLSGKEDSCGYWLKHGFDCVEKNKCHADGHYSTSTDQVITGIRSDKHDKNFTAQVFIVITIENR